MSTLYFGQFLFEIGTNNYIGIARAASRHEEPLYSSFYPRGGMNSESKAGELHHQTTNDA